jgi:mutator protein MutT
MSISPYMKNLREKVGHGRLQMPCVGAVIRKDGLILLQQRADDGRWGLPGGAIDPGEAPARAVVREVYEEVGLRVRPVRLLGVFGGFPRCRHVYPNGDEVQLLVHLFLCESRGGELRCQPSEVTDIRYFQPAEVAKRVTRYPAELFLEERDEPYFEWNEEWLEPIEAAARD